LSKPNGITVRAGKEGLYTDAETLARTNREITVFLKVRQHSSMIITGWVAEGIDASMQNEVGNSVMECRQLRLSVVAL
jgi:hypothetical protein